MRAMVIEELMRAYSRTTGKPCMLINFEHEFENLGVDECFDEVLKAAPYLTLQEHSQIMVDGCAVLEFETEEEMWQHYHLTIGDDGPTKENPYNGPAKVNALTCVDGELMAENT